MSIMMVYCRRAPVGAHLAFLVFPWTILFDRLHVSFTFTHTKLVTQSLHRIHRIPKLRPIIMSLMILNTICYIQIDTLDIEG